MENHPIEESRILSSVSGSELMATTSAISRWVRSAGEPDELASFHWIQERMESIGFRTEMKHHDAFISLPGEAEVCCDEGSLRLVGITHAFSTATDEGGVTGMFVDGADAKQDVWGSIVLIDGLANGESVRKWEKRGAVGQVYVHDDHLHETSVSAVWGNPTDTAFSALPSTPSLALRRSDAAKLRTRLADGPLSVTIHTKVLSEWRPIPILIADLVNAPATPFLLVASHVDSWHYGAMDNASANATAIEMARILAPIAGHLKRGVRIVFWSGHSHGRYAGSSWYVDEYWHELNDACVGYVFIDSTGGVNATVVTEPPVMPQTLGLASSVVRDVTGEELEGKRIGRYADQSFYGLGLNAVFGTLSEQLAVAGDDTVSFRMGGRRSGGLGWWWHTPDDTIDKVDEANLCRDTKIYLATVYRLLTGFRLPFDYRPAIAEVIDVVRPRVEATRNYLDLTALMEDLVDARHAIGAMYAALDTWGDEKDAQANELLLRISRHLVPLAFHENGRFERDPAESLVPVPSLKDLDYLASLKPDDPAALQVATRLKRTSNWVRTEARAISSLIGQALDVEGARG